MTAAILANLNAGGYFNANGNLDLHKLSQTWTAVQAKAGCNDAKTIARVDKDWDNLDHELSGTGAPAKKAAKVA